MKTITAIAFVFLSVLSAQSAEKLQYNRDVRPILADNCFACHGPDSAARKGDLRIDLRDAAIEGGAIVPGNPDKSTLLQRVLTDDDSEIMPPPKTKKKLTAAQKEILKRWLAEGAEYQAHWSLIAPTRPPVPKTKDQTWVKNPIDAFILADLEKRGLKPAPEADRRTIARRLSLDLTGLPPKPADVEAFVNDKDPQAYEKYVDKLLSSVHWGEHRGRYWLDAARYGDTHGIHFDNFREIWAYRDWVIRAFNENKKFDQFTIEQLAGDLLPNPTLDQLIATGFNRCNITTNEGGVIGEEYLVLYTRDRTEVVNQIWMAFTANCAVCHSHKFDPLSMHDFYSMAAFFNNTSQGAMDGNIPNTPPIITVPRMEDRARWDEVSKKVAQAQTQLDSRKAAAKSDFQKWLTTVKPDFLKGKVPTEGLTFHAPLTEGKGKSVTYTVGGKEQTKTIENGFDWSINKEGRKGFTIRPGDSIELPDQGNFEKDQAFTISTWVSISKRGTMGSLIARMDNTQAYRGWDLWMQADRVGMHIVSSWPGNALKAVARTPLNPGKWYHVTATYDGSGKVGGIRIYIDGEQQPVDVEADTLKDSIKTKVPLKIGQRHSESRVAGVGLQDIRLFGRALTGVDAQQLSGSQRTAELLAKPADKRTPKETDELFNWWLVTLDTGYRELANQHRLAQQEEVAIRSRGTIAHVMSEKTTPPEAYVLFRGEYDKRRDKVGPTTPKVLPPMPGNLPKNRLGFAQWLLRPEHPLTARVTVNRFWQEMFGTGIVRTTGDFGVSGELPSHPELLDWLAIEFRDGGWDIKKFYKMMVTSNTYRQSALTSAEKIQKDPDNRLLSRGARYRLDGETVRDYALSVSGLLVPKIGGPSVKPYQPPGVWEAVAMIGSNTRDYKQDSGENLYRRSMYTFWKRSAPPASMEIFNAPNRETCTVRRDRTNTPLQALVTLNDVQFIEAARVLAESALKASANEDARIEFIASRILLRPLRAEEVVIVKQSLVDLKAAFQKKPDDAKKLISYGETKADPKTDPVDLAVWTMLTNELLNMDEVLNK